jgi:hypothetical protein
VIGFVGGLPGQRQNRDEQRQRRGEHDYEGEDVPRRRTLRSGAAWRCLGGRSRHQSSTSRAVRGTYPARARRGKG